MTWTDQGQPSKNWGVRHENPCFQVSAFQVSAFQTGEGQKASWAQQSSTSETWS